jgi:hypothetical protein
MLRCAGAYPMLGCISNGTGNTRERREPDMEAKDTTILEIARRGDASEGQLFDELSKGLASGAISRRRALKLAGAAILGSTGLLALFPRVAGAQSIMDETEPTIAASDPGCRGEPAINNRRCPNNICRGREDCLCAETVHGDKRCVELLFESCPRRDQCDDSRDCPKGEICIKVGGCCRNRRRNLCAFPCG